jgi:large subunit ribosomal protein L15
MKLHDLKPAPGSRKAKRRVGRGIASGQGKTAGRGTKGQKARAGGSIPAWFEGGQTPLHQRIPKLHGFRNPFRIEYEVVNVGAIANIIELGLLESGEMPGATKKPKATPAPVTVNQEILRAAGLVRTLNKPMKILGAGELSTALFVVADAVSGSARSKIEAAGGSVSLLEVPKERKAAVGVKPESAATADTDPDAEPAGKAKAKAAKSGASKGDRTEAIEAAESGPVEAEAAESEPVEAEAEAATSSSASAEADSTGEAEPIEAKAANAPDESEATDTPAAEPAAPEAPAKAPKARAPRKPKAAAPDTEA